MENILDASESYLRIFTREVEVDKRLPKHILFEEFKKSQKEDATQDSETVVIEEDDLHTADSSSGITYQLYSNSILSASTTSTQIPSNRVVKISSPINTSKAKKRKVTPSMIEGMTKEEFSIFVSQRIIEGMKMSYGESTFNGTWSMSNPVIKSSTKKSIIESVKQLFRKTIENGKTIREPVIELNIFDFFNNVKLMSQKSRDSYRIRIEPFMIAIRDAQEMSQDAIVESLIERMFVSKFESILRAEGFGLKISEAQLVDFVKKTEKGVRLSYIKNYSRPIPREVIRKKTKADQCLVFDNYVVLYYDPEEKSYKQTQKEREEERRKKSDPILFGVFRGSKELYYIADWKDEFCDLTLDEFLKVSGIDKEHLQIEESIQI